MKISFVVQSPTENIIYSVCSSPPIFLNCVGSYNKECPKPKRLVVASGVYFTFGIDNLVTWHSNKQNPVTRSRAEAEYCASAHTASKMLQVRFGIGVPPPMEMYCGNHATIFNASNQIIHKGTKHI